MAFRTTGRLSADVVDQMRDAIRSGMYGTGRYLPPTRALGNEYGVCFETARRALKILEKEGLVESVPRHGFKVTESAVLPATTCPVAYVTYFRQDLSDAHPVNWAVNRALQESAARRGWSVLGIHCGENNPSQLEEQLDAARVWGVVLDAVDVKLLDAVRKTGRPVVMTNSWFEDADVDAVVQDNYRGGHQAVEHLVQSGAECIAWIGYKAKFSASRERFAGATAALTAHGREFPADFVIDTSDADAAERVRSLLQRPDRPDGICVFWKKGAREVVDVASELGLSIGSDLHLVGWSVDELWGTEHEASYSGIPTPAAVVWGAGDMAEAALERLETKRRDIDGKPLRINVATRIRKAH